MLDESDITERKYDNIFLGTHELYKASLNYTLKKIPLKDVNAVWIDIPQRLSSKFGTGGVFHIKIQEGSCYTK